MAFWKFGFHSQSAIDSILSSSSANQHHANPNAGCSTPLFSNPGLLLDKLLEEDDLLQEIKAQHPKLIEFLGTREVVSRILGYVSGLIFDDEEADRIADHSDSTLNRFHTSTSTSTSSTNPSASPPSSSTAVMGYGGAFLNSFRTRVVSDTIGALLMDALDSEGRTPEDRAKAERRKIRYPYLCTEILASDLWSVTSQIFSDFPRLNLLTRFWDAVLDQPPSATASKSVQIGYWAKANITLINSKPAEMTSFIKSYPNLIPKLLAHFNSSPIVDVLMRIVQSEQTSDGIIDWLIDSTDFVELIISLLHPSRTPDLHRSVAEFLKDLIAFCTNQAIPNSPSTSLSPSKLPTASPSTSEGAAPINPSASSPDLQHPLPNSTAGPSTQQPSDASDDHPKFITTRLMRELSSPAVISKLLFFGLDTPISEDDDVITNTTLASSLINSLSVVIDLIRRNNSDYSEHQLMVYLRDYPPTQRAEEEGSSTDRAPLSDGAPRVVPLIGLLNAIGDRLGDLQALIKTPRSSIKPLPTVVGLLVPLTQERFRLIELYAELLHCSNMALVNRLESEPRPLYNDDGALVGGLDALIAIFGPVNEEPLSDGPLKESSSEDVPQTKSGETSCTLPKIPADVTTTVEANDDGKKTELQKQASSKEEGGAVPAGVRMKQLFREHKVLDSCFDLFFQFPWNNFLHNVIYDLVQQTLNAKFSLIQPSSLASLQLAQSFFRETRIVDRLLDGVDANHLYQSQSKKGRLGNMGHLILIGDEVLKALENNPEEFHDIMKDLETNERWKAFVKGPIDEAREHAKLPLGGVMPVMSGILEATALMPATTDEVEDKLMATTSVPASGVGESGPMQLVDGIGGGGGGGGVGKNAKERAKKRTKDEDGPEEEAESRGGEHASSRAGEAPKTSDYDQDQWDSSRASDPSSFRPSRLSDPSSNPPYAASIISNPTPFGFDDRFDAPPHAFPQRFEDPDQSGDHPGGFDDDFGALQEAEPRGLTRGTPRPTIRVAGPTEGGGGVSAGTSSSEKGSVSAVATAATATATEGGEEGAKEDDDEWGEFAGPPSQNSPAVLPPQHSVESADEDAWNDFDLMLHRTNITNINPPESSHPSSPPSK